MAARAGMTSLIEILRGMCEAGTIDYSIGTANYWDDDHLQIVLDRYRLDIYHEQLGKIETWSGGTVQYLDYSSRYKNFEKTTGGTAVFIIEHGTGDDVSSSNYTPDYFRGRLTFSSDTGGSTLYLTGRSYDLDAVAADIWRQKAAHVAHLYDFSTDSHRFARSQYMQHCMKMSDFYASRGHMKVTTLTRSDIDDSALK